jgi:hypothetical protein
VRFEYEYLVVNPHIIVHQAMMMFLQSHLFNYHLVNSLINADRNENKKMIFVFQNQIETIRYHCCECMLIRVSTMSDITNIETLDTKLQKLVNIFLY